MRVLIAGVMHSPNLGDGLIAMCMTSLINGIDPDIKVDWLDFAGRTELAMGSSAGRTKVLAALARLPNWVSAPISAQLVQHQIRNRLAPRVPEKLDRADMVIIGGGQLLSDANLNFPLKISYLVRQIEARGLPFAIHGVGVSEIWSARAAQLFEPVLRSPNLRSISVRDAASASALKLHYSKLGVRPPCLINHAPDPVLCADALQLPDIPRAGQLGRRVGIGVVHPAVLATHGSDTARMSVEQMISDYTALANALVQHGVRVHFFTNGAGEDEELLDALFQSMPANPAWHRTPRRTSPRELAAFLKSLDAVASHRLHACITANAYGVKAVGFEWDPKINAYFDLTNQSENLFAGLDWLGGTTEALITGLEPQVRARIESLKPLVVADLERMLAAVTKPGHALRREADPRVPTPANVTGAPAPREPA